MSSEQQGPSTGASEWQVLSGPGVRWWRLLAVLLVVLVLTQVVLVLLAGPGPSRVVGLVANLLLVLLALAQVRPRTRATADGLLVRGYLTRERLLPWSDIESIDTEGGRWATDVAVRLTDGSRVTLPAVPPEQGDAVRAARPPRATLAREADPTDRC
ncbi:hypothetical protein BJF80_11540 [Serinicoccus sp. CUA-874]|uniref:PH domain-containing protein n=1 Tax=Serinicoccus sp. CUA-874 TaxID=1517939 RepID=UPI00096716DD|nr:PH domain-containing protein [Serinicoccus sp. CUA-874]OLT14991.1 hypothetical protein BJF80_11540 [Serinicoccus sp. CUA-874]